MLKHHRQRNIRYEDNTIEQTKETEETIPIEHQWKTSAKVS